MTLDEKIQLIDLLIAENPDVTIKDYNKFLKSPATIKIYRLKRAEIVLNRIAAERYNDLRYNARTTGVQ